LSEVDPLETSMRYQKKLTISGSSTILRSLSRETRGEQNADEVGAQRADETATVVIFKCYFTFGVGPEPAQAGATAPGKIEACILKYIGCIVPARDI
jgi:hypothetical protein